jgi:hypothetical protein
MKRLILSLLSFGSLFADVRYNLIVDPYFTPYIGADDLLSTCRGLEALEDTIYKPPHGQTFLNDTERFADLFLVWEPINYMAMVTQHEVFGHGFWVRSLHSDHAFVKRYEFGAPPPYGPGGGGTLYSFAPSQITAFQELAITSGGVEATAILANRLKLQWLQRGTINPRQATLYLYSQQDLTLYAADTNQSDEDGHDISHYVRILNKTYPKGHLTDKSVQQHSLVNLLDPFTYYSIYDWFYYIFTGKQGPMPMISIGQYNYLPGARYGLTPFGPEYYFENFLVKQDKPIYFYVRGGSFAKENYWGFGIEHGYLWTIDSMPWGFRLDFWRQPHTAFRNKKYSMENLEKEGHFHTQPHDPHYGICLSLIGHKKLWSTGALYFQIGGKTVGYLPGEPLQPAVIARIGLTIW